MGDLKDGETHWSLFLTTVYELYETLDERYLEPDASLGKLSDYWKNELDERADRSLTKLRIISKVAGVSYGKEWIVPVLLKNIVGNC